MSYKWQSENIGLLVSWLFKDGRDWLKQLPPNDWRDKARRELGSYVTFFSELDHLERVIPNQIRTSGSFNGQLVIVRPPGREDVLPVLHCHWKDLIDNASPELRLKLGFFLHDPDYEHGYRFSGWRFETPEGPGNHNYYHCQQIKGLQKNDNVSQKLACNWMPVSYPATPLNVDAPFLLLTALIVSIRGNSILSKRKTLQLKKGGKQMLAVYEGQITSK